MSRSYSHSRARTATSARHFNPGQRLPGRSHTVQPQAKSPQASPNQLDISRVQQLDAGVMRTLALSAKVELHQSNNIHKKRVQENIPKLADKRATKWTRQIVSPEKVQYQDYGETDVSVSESLSGNSQGFLSKQPTSEGNSSQSARVKAGETGGFIVVLGRWEQQITLPNGKTISLPAEASKKLLQQQAVAIFPDSKPGEIMELPDAFGSKEERARGKGGAWQTLKELEKQDLNSGKANPNHPLGWKGLPSGVAVQEALEGGMTVHGKKIDAIFINVDNVDFKHAEGQTASEYRQIIAALASGRNNNVDIVIAHGSYKSIILRGSNSVEGDPLPTKLRPHLPPTFKTFPDGGDSGPSGGYGRPQTRSGSPSQTSSTPQQSRARGLGGSYPSNSGRTSTEARAPRIPTSEPTSSSRGNSHNASQRSGGKIPSSGISTASSTTSLGKSNLTTLATNTISKTAQIYEMISVFESIDSAVSKVRQGKFDNFSPHLSKEVSALIDKIEVAFPPVEKVKAKVFWGLSHERRLRKYPTHIEWLTKHGLIALTEQNDLLMEMSEHLQEIAYYASDHDNLLYEINRLIIPMEPFLQGLKERADVLYKVIQNLENSVKYAKIYQMQIALWGVRDTFDSVLKKHIEPVERMLSTRNLEYKRAREEAATRYREAAQHFHYWGGSEFKKAWESHFKKPLGGYSLPKVPSWALRTESD